MTRIRPSVFIGSSTEGLEIATALQALLERPCEVTVWNQGVFALSEGRLESLVRALDEFDFAILVLTADDLVSSREVSGSAPRDNVLFELGLFMGGLGKKRTFIVHDRTAGLKLPSDLAGVSTAEFQPHASGNLKSALGAAANDIREQIVHLGIRERERLRQLSDAARGFDTAAVQMQKLVELIARSRKVELEIISNQFGLFIAPDKLKQINRDLSDLEATLTPTTRPPDHKGL